MPRQPLAAVLLLGAVLGALVASASAAPPDETYSANRGWDAPPSDVVDRLDGS